MSAARGEHASVMTIGALSRRTGVPVKALREYEDAGLIYTMGRSPGNYRLFDETALWCVGVIGTLRALGLTLAEIRELATTPSTSGDRRNPLVRTWRGCCTRRDTALTPGSPNSSSCASASTSSRPVTAGSWPAARSTSVPTIPTSSKSTLDSPPRGRP